MMGSDANQLDKCVDELKAKLRNVAYGKWIDACRSTTERYERVLNRASTELANIDLIAKTWNTTEAEAHQIWKKETDEELNKENNLRLFAITLSSDTSGIS